MTGVSGTPPGTRSPQAERLQPRPAIAHQLRGSSLLVVGRGISIGISLLVQVLIVRHLSKSGFGSFAYGLSVVAVAQTVVTFGLHRAIPRFVPIYEERGEYDKLLGVIVLVAITIGSLGAVTVGLVVAVPAAFAGNSLHDPHAASLLAVLILLAPLQALDSALMSLFGVLARPRAIFVRTYLLAPALKLGVVLLLIAAHRGVVFLAAGYVAATAAGIVLYGVLLVATLREQGLMTHFRLSGIRVPAREVFALTVPLLTTDLVYVLLLSTDAILLGHFHGATAVGSFRVIQPAAALNELVLGSFLLLYTPLAARFFARADHEGLSDLYWQTAAWIAVASFPIFALTFAGAQPLTTMVFGDRYSSSAIFLSILSCGYFVQAALGFNGTTLTVFGRVRGISILNVVAMVVNVGLNLLLIPRWGGLGAAVGTASTLVMHNLLKQIALHRATGIALIDRRYASVYLSIIAAVPALIAIRFIPASPPLTFAAVAAVTLLFIAVNRRFLRVSETFPEIRQLPLARQLFAARA